MPTKPPVATVAPSRTSRTASAAETILFRRVICPPPRRGCPLCPATFLSPRRAVHGADTLDIGGTTAFRSGSAVWTAAVMRHLLRYPARLNAAAAFLDAQVSAGRSDHPAVVGDAETLTYAELRNRAALIASALVRDLGLVPGNRVLLRSANTP